MTAEPAFPNIKITGYAKQYGFEPGNDGMSLRDYFAGQALNSLVCGNFVLVEDKVRLAYKFADAMLKERDKGHE